MTQDEFFTWLFIAFVVWKVYTTIKDWIQTITKKLPEWHGLHGEAYIKWKKEKDELNSTGTTE